MKDTARMKAISDADLEKSGKKVKKKSSGFGIFINSFGMILLAVMLVIVGVNFSRDSRIMQKSRLSANANATAATTVKNISDYTEASVQVDGETKSTNGGKQGGKGSGTRKTEKTEAVTPTVTPEP